MLAYKTIIKHSVTRPKMRHCVVNHLISAADGVVTRQRVTVFIVREDNQPHKHTGPGEED